MAYGPGSYSGGVVGRVVVLLALALSTGVAKADTVMGMPTASVVFVPMSWEEKVGLVTSYGGHFKHGVARARVDLVTITLVERGRKWCVERVEKRQKRCGDDGVK